MQMVFVQRYGTKPALPQMPGHPHPGVDIARVVAVHMTEGLAEAIGIARHR